MLINEIGIFIHEITTEKVSHLLLYCSENYNKSYTKMNKYALYIEYTGRQNNQQLL